MAEISAELVRELREATNLGMMECKKALVEAGGDKEKAVRLLRERGMAVAQKRAGRAANQGVIASASRGTGLASLAEVNCETDFVARNAAFQEFARQMAEKAADTDGNLAESEKALVTAKIAEIGENIVLRRNTRLAVSGPGVVGSYVHLGGKIGVLVEVGVGKEETTRSPHFGEMVKDLAMHIAASAPQYLDDKAVPEAVLASEREIYAKQITGKPANIVEKIVQGKIKKFFADVCLLDQGFVKEPKQPISAMLAARGKDLGDSICVRRFARYQIGQPA